MSYGMELLKSGTSLEGLSKEDVLYNDYKLYTVNEKTFSIGQFFTMNFADIESELDKYIDVLDRVAEANNYNLVCLYVTDIIKNGSYVLFNRKGLGTMRLAYNEEVGEGYLYAGEDIEKGWLPSYLYVSNRTTLIVGILIALILLLGLVLDLRNKALRNRKQ